MKNKATQHDTIPSHAWARAVSLLLVLVVICRGSARCMLGFGFSRIEVSQEPVREGSGEKREGRYGFGTGEIGGLTILRCDA
jgi:hypothetical protein